MVTTPKRQRVRRWAWCLCREFEGMNPKSLHFHPKHKIRVTKHPSIIQRRSLPLEWSPSQNGEEESRGELGVHGWRSGRRIQRAYSGVQQMTEKHWQHMTQRGAGLWMLIAPQRLRVRRRAWCLQIENERSYKMDSCFVGNKQYLKEISSFEAADDGVSWR